MSGEFFSRIIFKLITFSRLNFEIYWKFSSHLSKSFASAGLNFRPKKTEITFSFRGSTTWITYAFHIIGLSSTRKSFYQIVWINWKFLVLMIFWCWQSDRHFHKPCIPHSGISLFQTYCLWLLKKLYTFEKERFFLNLYWKLSCQSKNRQFHFNSLCQVFHSVSTTNIVFEHHDTFPQMSQYKHDPFSLDYLGYIWSIHEFFQPSNLLLIPIFVT